MKKKIFYCFQPLALETAEGDNKNSLKNSGQRNNPKWSFSQKIKISAGRKIHRLSPQSEYEKNLEIEDSLRKTHTHLKVSDYDDDDSQKDYDDDDDDVRLVKGADNNIQETEITSSKNKTSSTTDEKSLPFDGNIIRSKPCCSNTKINPGLCLFVTTLFFTIVWGRATAILFTLVLLYLFHLASQR